MNSEGALLMSYMNKIAPGKEEVGKTNKAMDWNEILKQIATLDATSRQRILDSLAGEASTAKSASFSSVEHDAYEVLTRVCGKWIPSLDEMVEGKGLGGRRGFTRKCEAIFAIIAEGCPEPLRRAQRMALAVECMDCLADYVSHARIAGVKPDSSAKNLLNNVDKLKTAIDHNYPGYIEVKMLHRIVPMKIAA